MSCTHKIIADHIVGADRHLFTCTGCRRPFRWGPTSTYLGNIECTKCQTARVDAVFCMQSCKLKHTNADGELLNQEEAPEPKAQESPRPEKFNPLAHVDELVRDCLKLLPTEDETPRPSLPPVINPKKIAERLQLLKILLAAQLRKQKETE